ncbi:MAG: A/G-specific adenine glycosylase [Flavobacteriales bacterium]
MIPQKTDINSLTIRIHRWYDKNQRSLPWRETDDPYLIWLSEVILQQTRVDQGLPYFLRFREAFPKVQDLANASEDAVLKLWQGLGYYSRARNLHTAAKQVLRDFGGNFPSSYNQIIELKGVGSYTAAAIASIAFEEPKAVVDGNVIRVISRIQGIEEAVNATTTHKLIQSIADDLIDPSQPAKHNQAMMEFGALQCVPKNPNCLECPINDSCTAYRANKVEQIPFKEKKLKRRSRYFHYFIIFEQGHILLDKRNDGDIWANLYQFPLIETTSDFEPDRSKIIEELDIQDSQILSIVKSPKHVLSHQDIHATFYTMSASTKDSTKFNRIKPSELHTFALPRLIDRHLEKHPL